MAADGSLYFMTKTSEAKSFRLYRSQYRTGSYEQAVPLSFSDGSHADVDPDIAPDESFLIFSSAGRAAASDTHEHLYITFRLGSSWGPVEPLRYAGDYEKNPADDGEPSLSPDHRVLFFTSDRTTPTRTGRTRSHPVGSRSRLERLNLWDNGNNNAWSISRAPSLDTARETVPRQISAAIIRFKRASRDVSTRRSSR